MRKILALLLSAAMLAGMMSACTNEKPDYTPTGNGLAGEEATEPPAGETAVENFSLAYYPDCSLNPYECGEVTNRVLFSLVYQGLFSVNSSYEAQPVLCREYAVSPDMQTYTFYPEAATFSDGTPLTADDVAASLKAAVKSDYYGGRFGFVEKISTTDDGGVKVKLTTPYENFPLLLDVPIVPAAQVGSQRPLGTGAYFYESQDSSFWLRRRTDWWCDAQLSLTAEYVPLVAGESPSQIRDAFEFSDVGLVCADPGAEEFAEFHSDYELWDCESGVFLYLAWNRNSSLYSEAAVRNALSGAIDRDGLLNTYYRSFAYSAVLPASPQSPMYDGTLAAQCTYDPSRLTLAVSNADLEGAEVVLLVNKADTVRLRVARQIAAELSESGWKVTTSELAGQDYLEALEEGEFDLHLGQTRLAANMDLSAFFAPDGSLNFGDLEDEDLYALCLDALANSGNYYTLYQKILEDGALCPILFRSYAVYAQRGLFTQLEPARDHVFYYHVDKQPEDTQEPEAPAD